MFKTCFSIFEIYKLDCFYLAQIMSVMAIVSVIVTNHAPIIPRMN